MYLDLEAPEAATIPWQLAEDVAVVADVEQVFAWDGKNTAGNTVANNVYFCVLEVDGEVKSVCKIAVLR